LLLLLQQQLVLLLHALLALLPVTHLKAERRPARGYIQEKGGKGKGR
jgi:hypothetical protein